MKKLTAVASGMQQIWRSTHSAGSSCTRAFASSSLWPNLLSGASWRLSSSVNSACTVTSMPDFGRGQCPAVAGPLCRMVSHSAHPRHLQGRQCRGDTLKIVSRNGINLHGAGRQRRQNHKSLGWAAAYPLHDQFYSPLQFLHCYKYVLDSWDAAIFRRWRRARLWINEATSTLFNAQPLSKTSTARSVASHICYTLITN